MSFKSAYSPQTYVDVVAHMSKNNPDMLIEFLLYELVNRERITFKNILEIVANILSNFQSRENRNAQRTLYKTVITRKYKDHLVIENVDEAVKIAMTQWDLDHPKPKFASPRRNCSFHTRVGTSLDGNTSDDSPTFSPFI